MALNPDFNYQDKLALDKAKLISRTRINNLGSYELVIQYSMITSAMREDALEWLAANRLSVTDPTVSFKTYEGEWNCVDISYSEDRALINQRFKIDVGVGDLGDWDGDPPEPTWSSQAGDLSRISDGMEIQRAYYWRVTNPENYNLPESSQEGEIWTKTANDNGDGTYDVIVGREVAQNQTAVSYRESEGVSETTTRNSNTDAASAPVRLMGR